MLNPKFWDMLKIFSNLMFALKFRILMLTNSDADLEKAASGACGHFLGNSAILRASHTFD